MREWYHKWSQGENIWGNTTPHTPALEREYHRKHAADALEAIADQPMPPVTHRQHKPPQQMLTSKRIEVTASHGGGGGVASQGEGGGGTAGSTSVLTSSRSRWTITDFKKWVMGQDFHKRSGPACHRAIIATSEALLCECSVNVHKSLYVQTQLVFPRLLSYS